MALFKLDDVFTYQDANEIKTLWASDEELTAGVEAEEGEVRLELAPKPIKLKRRTDTGWEVIGEMTGQQVLEKLLDVHGAGSQLDADKLDGQEGSYYQDAANINAGTLDKNRLPAEAVRTDQNTDVSANTEWQDGQEARFGSGADLRITHTGTQTTLTNYTGDLYFTNVAPGKRIYCTAHQSDGTWRTMLRFDPDSGANGSLLVPLDNTYFRIGASGDLWLFHNGTSSFIDNQTGHMYHRQLSHGKHFYFQGENSSGTMKTLLTMEPDRNTVKVGGILNIADPFASDNVLTVSNGEVTITSSCHRLDTEGGAATDELYTINGGKSGDILILMAATHQRDVTLMDTYNLTNGNLRLAGNFSFSDTRDKVVLIACEYPPEGTLEWHELSRSNNQ